MSNNTDQQKTNIGELIIDIRQVDLSLRSMLEKTSDYTRVILLGSTGVSKSTISNAIVGNPLQIQKDDCGDIYLVAERSQFEMGPSMVSKTTVPNIYVDHKNKIVICDAPGFDDTRGTAQDIINSFSIDQLFKSPCKIKTLFVFAKEQIDGAGKGLDLTKNIERLYSIFPNEYELNSSLGIIVSRGDGRPLDSYMKSFMNENPNKACQKFCQFYLQHIDDRVFEFPLAESVNVGKQYIFKDHQKLMNFLSNSPVKNPTHMVVLGEKAKYDVIRIFQSVGKIEDSVKDLFNQIEKIYITERPELEELEDIKNRYEIILRNIDQIETPTDFVGIIERNIKNPELVEDTSNRIKCFEHLFWFINNINGFERVFDPVSFKQNVKYILNDEIMKITTLINVKNLEIQIQKSQNEVFQAKNKVYELELTVEQKDEEKRRLENEMKSLLQQAHDETPKTDEEIQSLKGNMENALVQYQTLNQEKNEEGGFSLTGLLSKIGPIFDIVCQIANFIGQFA